MAAYYKKRGKTLTDRLCEIYSEHGYSVTELRSYTFKGADGFMKMQEIMDSLRATPPAPCGLKLDKALDFEKGLDGLPPSNVLKLQYNSASLTARPSGTEPKLKLYVYAEGESEEAARSVAEMIFNTAEKYIK